jgi:hypothetical protein
MNTQIRTGRIIVLSILIGCLVLSLSTIVLTNLISGAEQLIAQTIRFVLTLLLCIVVYQGKVWARWVLSILLLIGGVFALSSGVGLLAVSPIALVLVVMGLVYLAGFASLLFLPHTRAFFAYQRNG